MTAHTLEAASSLDHRLLPPLQRDTYPDREFYSPLRRALQRILLTGSWTGRSEYASFGQDMGSQTGLVEVACESW